jgi:hypothetical protein
MEWDIEADSIRIAATPNQTLSQIPTPTPSQPVPSCFPECEPSIVVTQMKNYVHMTDHELSKKFHLVKYDLPTKSETQTSLKYNEL